MTSFLISAYLFHQKWGSSITNLAQIWHRDSSLNADSYFWLKRWLRGRFRTIWHKNNYFMSLFGQTPLGNSITMATVKVRGDHKLELQISSTFQALTLLLWKLEVKLSRYICIRSQAIMKALLKMRYPFSRYLWNLKRKFVRSSSYQYLFINWLPGPYWKILSPKLHSTERTKWGRCDVTEDLIFSVRTG